MVYTFATYTEQLPDPMTCPHILEGLPQERREKILRNKMENSRKQSLGAGLLLQEVFARCGLSMETIYVDENGKPGADGLFFNLSHSGSLVLCAAAGNPVGCDAEQIRTVSRKVIQRFFAPAEIRYLDQFSGQELDREFCRIWTRKESYIKMTGEGMRLAFNRFDVTAGEEKLCTGPGIKCGAERMPCPGSGIKCGAEGMPCPGSGIKYGEAGMLYPGENRIGMVGRVCRDGKMEDCFLHEYDIPGYRVSVCSGEACFAQEIEFVELFRNMQERS